TAGLRYVATDFGSDQGIDAVAAELEELDRDHGTAGNRVYYFAVPPSAIGTLVQQIGERRTARGWTRLVIEKPFGHDLESARELNALLAKYFVEHEIFRIDHYL